MASMASSATASGLRVVDAGLAAGLGAVAEGVVGAGFAGGFLAWARAVGAGASASSTSRVRDEVQSARGRRGVFVDKRDPPFGCGRGTRVPRDPCGARIDDRGVMQGSMRKRGRV